MNKKLRNRVVVPALAAAMLGGGLALSGCGSSDSVVRYEVTGAGPPAKVSYNALQQGTTLVSNQLENDQLPVTREFHVPKNDSNDYMLSAYRFPGGGPISCKITVDGQVVAEEHSPGGGMYSTVTCMKITPFNPSNY